MSLRRRCPRDTGFLDLTPCSDIIFTLLLFYILTQSYLTCLPMALPRLQAGEHSTAAHPLRIEVQASGTILWNGAPLPTVWESAVRERMKRLATETAVVLLAESKAPAGLVIELLDRLRAAGVRQVAFGGQPLSGSSSGAEGWP